MYCKQLPVHPVNDKSEEVEELGYHHAVEAMKRRHHKGDLLEALIRIEEMYNEAANDIDEDELDEFLWDYCYEIAYFNLICREMAPLFAPKEVA